MLIKNYFIYQLNYKKRQLFYLIKEFQWLLPLVKRLRPDIFNYFKNKDKLNLTFLILLLIEKSNKYNYFINKIFFQNFLEKKVPLSTYSRNVIRWFYSQRIEKDNLWNLITTNEKKILYKLEYNNDLYNIKNKTLINKKHHLEKKIIKKNCTILRKKINTYRLIPTIKRNKILFSIYIFSKKRLPFNPYDIKMDISTYNRYIFNIFCIPTLESFKSYSKNINNAKNCYNIFYFPEKLKYISDKRLFSFNLFVDEIWVCSRFNYDILASLCLKPVLIIPYALKIVKRKDKEKENYFLFNSVPKNRLIFVFNNLITINKSILY